MTIVSVWICPIVAYVVLPIVSIVSVILLQLVVRRKGFRFRCLDLLRCQFLFFQFICICLFVMTMLDSFFNVIGFHMKRVAMFHFVLVAMIILVSLIMIIVVIMFPFDMSMVK